MTSVTIVLNAKTTVSSEYDPELMYFTWKVNIQNRAANIATIVDRSGLLSLILTDAEWANYSANRTVEADGSITIAPRPQAPVHIPITNGMTNANISVAKYSNDRHATWHEAQESSFKAMLNRSLGPTLEGTLGPPPDGFTLLSVQQIVNAVKNKYGTVDQMALSKMEDILTSPLDHVKNLDKHLANLKQHPIAPVGTKILTWDAPDHRGSWADHGVEAVYLGPAIEHLRSFEVWVPNTSAPRITNTVW
jgi:hypothetical protein